MNTKFDKMKDTITELRNRPMYDDKFLLSEVQFSRQNMMLEKSKRIRDSLDMELLKEDWAIKENKYHRNMNMIKIFATIMCIFTLIIS